MTTEKPAIEVRIGSHLSLALNGISELALNDIAETFTHKNPAYAKAKSMGYAVVNEPQTYKAFAVDYGKNRVTLWRGTARRLKTLLEFHGYQVVWRDRRLRLPETGLTLGKLVLQEEQAPAVEDLLKFQQGLLRGNTGSGKTEMLLAAAVMSQQPTLVQVWNKGLLKQWVERIVKWEILPEREIGIIQGKKKKVGPITIAMIQTLNKCVDEFTDKFGTVIVDECQRTPATTFTKSANGFPAKFRWGATADEKRRDGKEFLAYEVFGYQEWEERAKVRHFPIAEVEGRGQSMDPQVIIVPTRYEDLQYEDDRNFGQLINRLVSDEDRNKLIAKYLRAALKDGRQIILFSERVESAKYWVDYVSSLGYVAGPLIGGQENQAETEATLKSLREGVCRFTATTTYADVGLDVPSLDCALVTCPTAGNIKRLHQQIGRIVRPLEGKRDPIAYYFWDMHVGGISKGIKNIKKKWKKAIQLDQ